MQVSTSSALGVALVPRIVALWGPLMGLGEGEDSGVPLSLVLISWLIGGKCHAGAESPCTVAT